MEFVQFDDIDNEEAEIPQKWKAYHNNTKPFRFIDDLNRTVSNEEHTEKHQIYHDFDQGFDQQRTESLAFRAQMLLQLDSDQTEPISNLEEKVMGGSCPVRRSSHRKQLSIQKKRSSAYPLDGNGFTKLEDGRVVFGMWKNGMFHGNAKIMYPSADVYIGQVKDYNRHGKGALILKNGERYVGNFCNGKCEGYGIKYDQNGEVKGEGIWKNGFLVKRAN